MQITAKSLDTINANVIILGFFEDDKTLSPIEDTINQSAPLVDEIISKGGFKGKYLETYVYTCPCSKKILAVGLGKKVEFTKDKMREVAAKTVKQAEKLTNNKTVAIEPIKNDSFCSGKACYNTALGALIGTYDFDKYKSKKNEDKIENLEILTDETEKREKCINKAQIIAASMDFTKDLVNEPASYTTPSKMADIAAELANENGLDIKILSKQELKDLNFNTFLAVGQGSIEEPKFIHMTYYPGENPTKKIAIIGKGITFDSGGLDIKPASSMLNMKTDMTGAATVLGVMKAINKLAPSVEVHMLSALCENMPSGSSYKPGDILIAKNGKTIEVDNTDAEGRLTLADVLTYADSLGVDEVIDIATLTGAVIVALGQNITGVMGNNNDFIKDIIECAQNVGENIWQMPVLDDMQDNLKSDVADMRNTGSRFAGASVAARFLNNFTECKRWAHLDIAGTSFIDKPYKELSKGATAAMVRTLIEYICK